MNNIVPRTNRLEGGVLLDLPPRCFCILCSPNVECGIYINNSTLIPCPGCGHSITHHTGSNLGCGHAFCDCKSFGHLDIYVRKRINFKTINCSVNLERMSLNLGSQMDCCQIERIKMYYGKIPNGIIFYNKSIFLGGKYYMIPDGFRFDTNFQENLTTSASIVSTEVNGAENKVQPIKMIVTARCVKCGDNDPWTHICGTKKRTTDITIKKIKKARDLINEIPF